MAYTPTVWKNGDVITAELLNHLETGVQNEQVGPEGPAGPTGAAGASVTAIELYKDESGAITGGKATLSDASEITITVTTTPTV